MADGSSRHGPRRATIPAIPDTGRGAVLMQFEGHWEVAVQAVLSQRRTDSGSPSSTDARRSGRPANTSWCSCPGERSREFLVTGNVLIWQEAGFTFRLESALPEAGAVRIAESVQPVAERGRAEPPRLHGCIEDGAFDSPKEGALMSRTREARTVIRSARSERHRRLSRRLGGRRLPHGRHQGPRHDGRDGRRMLHAHDVCRRTWRDVTLVNRDSGRPQRDRHLWGDFEDMRRGRPVQDAFDRRRHLPLRMHATTRACRCGHRRRRPGSEPRAVVTPVDGRVTRCRGRPARRRGVDPRERRATG